MEEGLDEKWLRYALAVKESMQTCEGNKDTRRRRSLQCIVLKTVLLPDDPLSPLLLVALICRRHLQSLFDTPGKLALFITRGRGRNR